MKKLLFLIFCIANFLLAQAQGVIVEGTPPTSVKRNLGSAYSDSFLVIRQGPLMPKPLWWPAPSKNVPFTPIQIGPDSLLYWYVDGWRTFSGGGGGGGGVSFVGNGYGILGGPITSSGTIRFDSATVNSLYRSWLTWPNLSGKPSTFPPSAHTHTISEVTNLGDSLSRMLRIRDSGKIYASKYTFDTSNKSIWTVLSSRGTVNQVGSGYGIIGGPITNTGVLSLDTLTLNPTIKSWITWSNLFGKPSTFPPSAHTHAITEVTNLPDSLSRMLRVRDSGKVYTSKYTFDTSNKNIWAAIAAGAGGGGTVTSVGSGYGLLGGPITGVGALRVDSATLGPLFRSWIYWDNVSGKPSTFTPSTHSHPVAQVTGLQDSLNTKISSEQLGDSMLALNSRFINNQNSTTQTGNIRISGSVISNQVDIRNNTGTLSAGSISYSSGVMAAFPTAGFNIRGGTPTRNLLDVDTVDIVAGSPFSFYALSTDPTTGLPSSNVAYWNTITNRLRLRRSGAYGEVLMNSDIPSTSKQIAYVPTIGSGSLAGTNNFTWDPADSSLNINGKIKMASMASGSASDSIVTVDASGTFKRRAQAIPGAGTVTSVATGYGVTGGPITGSGTISFDSATVNPLFRSWVDWNYLLNKPSTFAPSAHVHPIGQVTGLSDSLLALRTYAGTKGSGTVTSISNGYGILGGTITTTGSLRVDTGTLGPLIRSWNYWDAISGKPSTFTPSAHNHTIAQVTGLSDSLLVMLRKRDSTLFSTPYRNDTGNNKIRSELKDSILLVRGLIASGSADSIIFATNYSVDTAKANMNVRINARVPLIDSGIRYVTPYQNRLKLNTTDTAAMLSYYARLSALRDSMIAARSLIATKGTVNSVGTGYGLTGGTITNTGTIGLDTGTVNPIYRSWVDWNRLLNKPSTFAPSAHNHPISQVTGLSDSLVLMMRYRDSTTRYTSRHRFDTGTASIWAAINAGKSAIVYNIRDYGATPNDTTDDWMSIMTTIAVASMNGGGIVYIPPGRYELSSSIGVTSPNVHIKGSGIGSSILKLKSTAASIPGFSITPVVVMSDTFQRPLLNVSIENVSITTAVTYPDRTGTYGTDGVLMISCKNFRVENVEVSNTIVGIHIDGCEDGTITKNYVRNCSADGIAGFAFMKPNKRIVVSHNSVYQVGDDGISCNTYTDLGSASNEDYVISHNTMKAIGGGGISVWGAKRVLVTENTVDSSFSNSIKVASGYGFSDVENVIVSKNVFMNGAQRTVSGVGVVAEAAGITVLQYDTLFHVKGVDIIDNRIITPRGNYIAVHNATGTKFANDINLIDNKCIGGNTAAPVSDPYKRKWSDDGIYVNIKGDITVVENKIYRARENGINVTSLSSKYVSVSRNIVDSANIARTAGKAAILVNSSSRANVYNNTVRLIGSPDSSYICAKVPHGAWSNNLGGFQGRNISPVYFRNSEALADSLVVGMDYLSPFGERKIVVPTDVSLTPTVSFSAAGNGTGGLGTHTITGDSRYGVLTWTTGTSPSANSLIATVTFSGFGYPNNFYVRLTPRNKATSGYFGNGTHLLTAENWGYFTISSNDTALNTATEYSVMYEILPR